MRTLMTAKQVSEYLGVKLSTIRKWTHCGYIPHIKLGGAVRFDLAAVDAWIEKRSCEGRARMKLSAYESNARRSARHPITLNTD